MSLISGSTGERLAFMDSLRRSLMDHGKTIHILKNIALQREGGIAKPSDVAGRFSYTWEGCVAKKDGGCRDPTKTFALKVQEIRPAVGYIYEVMHEVAALALAHMTVKERICVNFPLSLAPLRLPDRTAALKMKKGAKTTAIVNPLAAGHFGQWISGRLRDHRSPDLLEASTLLAQVLMGVHTMNTVWHRYHNDLAGPNVLLYGLDKRRDFVYSFEVMNLVGNETLAFRLEIRDAPFLGVLWDFGMISPHQTMEEGDLGQFLEWLRPDGHTPTKGELEGLYSKLKDANALVDSFGEEALAALKKGKTFDLETAKEAAVSKTAKPRRRRKESPSWIYRKRHFSHHEGGRRWKEDPLETLRVMALTTTLAWFSEGRVRLAPQGSMTEGHGWWGVVLGGLLGMHIFELDEEEYDLVRDLTEPVERKTAWMANTLFGMDPEEAEERRPLQRPIRSTIRPLAEGQEEALVKRVEGLKWSSLKVGKVI